MGDGGEVLDFNDLSQQGTVPLSVLVYWMFIGEFPFFIQNENSFIEHQNNLCSHNLNYLPILRTKKISKGKTGTAF